MIPKILHHIWIGNNPIPDVNNYAATTVMKTHSDFEYKLWKDDDADKFIKTEFPEYYEKYNNLPRKILKIDMLRYFIMYKIGGLYTDMDYIMFKRFDLLDYDCVIPCNRESEEGNPTNLGNCIFASKPGHSFWKMLIDSLFTMDRQFLPYKTPEDVFKNTGPMFVYDSYCQYKEKHTIHVPRRKFFHPPTKLSWEEINELQKDNDIYGMHICTGLWAKPEYNL